MLNRCVKTYLRCMCHNKPQDWAKWLPLAEYWYNTNYHTAIKKTPYEIVYNQIPPVHMPYLKNSYLVEAIDRSLQQKEHMIQLLKEQIHRAQNRMKQQAEKHRADRQFVEGDWVLLKLQPYKQSSMVTRTSQELASKYFGPYKVIIKVGKVAYTLQLPQSSKVHPTFHVSMLK